ncbi:MAG: ABC-2 transporter permease [Clostridia bacterium]|nr:ABC-2 transporter permease [Clostridia bacterium]
MKGLILKDIYNLKGMIRPLIFLVVIFSLAFREQGMATLIIMFTVTSSVLIINSLATDEMYKWYSFAFSMPITCRQLVLSKYIVSAVFALAGILTGVILSMVLQAIGWLAPESPAMFAATVIVAFIVALLFISILLPVNLKFGVQKGRLLLLSLVALPVLLVVAITSLGMAVPSVMVYDIPSLYVIAGGLTAASALLTVISYSISVRIMEKKEF